MEKLLLQKKEPLNDLGTY